MASWAWISGVLGLALCWVGIRYFATGGDDALGEAGGTPSDSPSTANESLSPAAKLQRREDLHFRLLVSGLTLIFVAFSLAVVQFM